MWAWAGPEGGPRRGGGGAKRRVKPSRGWRW